MPEPEVRTEPRRRAMLGDRRMSDLESLLWTVDHDPVLSSNFGSITLLDRKISLPAFRKRMLRAAVRIPRLHQRVVPAPVPFGPPEWHDDPEFDIDRHVTRLTLRRPADLRQVLDLAALFIQEPLDRNHPLWHFVIVQGLPAGRSALIQKMHHTITDGEGGIRLSEQFIDVTRDAPEIEVPRLTGEGRTEPPSRVETAADALTFGALRAFGVLQRVAGVAGDTARHPQHLATMGLDVVEGSRSLLRQLTLNDHRHSPLWVEATEARRLEVLDVDFEDARRSAKALGGSLNDFFVAGAAAAAGAYHRDEGIEVAEMRIAMPVSTRRGPSAGGNSFVPTRVLVPTGDLDPVTRFRLVHAALNRTKEERAIGMVGGLAGVANLLPAALVIRAARQQAQTVDFTTSNVRAAPFDLFIGGARMEATYPLGPLAGTAFNLTMMSYAGALNMGLHVDAGMIADPSHLRDLLAESFAELIAAGT